MNRPTRFKVESLKAIIDFTLEGEFKAQYYAVVVNESYTGCCLAARNDGHIKENTNIRVKVGELKEMKANIRWLKKIDEDIIKFGIEYQE